MRVEGAGEEVVIDVFNSARGTPFVGFVRVNVGSILEPPCIGGNRFVPNFPQKTIELVRAKGLPCVAPYLVGKRSPCCVLLPFDNANVWSFMSAIDQHPKFLGCDIKKAITIAPDVCLIDCNFVSCLCNKGELLATVGVLAR